DVDVDFERSEIRKRANRSIWRRRKSSFALPGGSSRARRHARRSSSQDLGVQQGGELAHHRRAYRLVPAETGGRSAESETHPADSRPRVPLYLLSAAVQFRITVISPFSCFMSTDGSTLNSG